jgi:CBS domain containing-hemolysin-like protein
MKRKALIRKIDDHTYVFEGRTMINDVCKTMGLPTDTFDDVRGDSDSLAGLILELGGIYSTIERCDCER